jgi:hypothetical protein
VLTGDALALSWNTHKHILGCKHDLLVLQWQGVSIRHGHMGVHETCVVRYVYLVQYG